MLIGLTFQLVGGVFLYVCDKGAPTQALSMGEEMGKEEDEEAVVAQRGASPTASSPAKSLYSEL